MAMKLTPMQKELIGEAMLIGVGIGMALMLMVSSACGALYGIYRLVTLFPRRHPIDAVALLVMIALIAMVPTRAQPLPGASPRLLPQLTAEIDRFWPDLKPRAFVPALIEQESGWRPTATLKTSRELGCGLGQFTLASDSSGRVRFDALEETRRLDPSLASWSWKDCYQEQLQLRAVVLKLKTADRSCGALMRGNLQAKACDAAQYNGGSGSVTRRIRTCRIAHGCDARIWFDNLENQCPQSRIRVDGYGEDFCTINSRYPGRVFARMPKYEGKI